MPTVPTAADIETQVTNAIVKRVGAQWVDVNGIPRTAVKYPGVDEWLDYDKVTLLKVPPSELPWLRVEISGLSGDPLTLFSALDKHAGTIFLSVFVPRQKAAGPDGLIGEALLKQYVGFARAIFNRHNGRDDTPQQPYECLVSSSQRNDEAGWLSAVVSTPFFCFTSG